MPFVSYARNLEDALLNRALGGQALGFYVDIGAGHPTFGSVTRAFYDRGWNGINVEPGPHFDELAAARPRDVNLRLAVVDRTGATPFSITRPDLGLSHVVVRCGDQEADSVPCDTLENILRDHGTGRPLDFVKIDAQGSEAAIVGSTDWNKVRPRILVIAATLPWSNVLANADWEPALIDARYRRVYFDGISCFYVADEHAAALAHFFEVPANRLDGERFEGSVDGLAAARDAALVELGKERAALSRAREELKWLAADHAGALDASEGYRRQIKDLQTANSDMRAEADTALAERMACARDLVETRRERDDLALAYEAMARRADRLAGEVAAHRDSARQAVMATSESSPIESRDEGGYAQMMSTLARLRDVPAAVEEIRRALVGGEMTATVLNAMVESPAMRSLAADIERIVLTMAIDVGSGDGAELIERYDADAPVPALDRLAH